MPTPEVDRRSPARRAQDQQIASEPRKVPLELPADATSSPVESHLGRIRRPQAVAGVVENGRVFISCGQRSQQERQIVEDVRSWLEQQGFKPYVAIQSQSIQDVNCGIIKSLRNSDFYIFIDFERETLPSGQARGSLFTNQELAIAYTMGFDYCIFVRHQNVQLEGMAAHILSNAHEFTDRNNVVTIIQQEVTSRNWSPDYSRHLVVEDTHWNSHGVIHYSDHTGRMDHKIWHVKIGNHRHDLGALQATARLVTITDPAGTQQASPDLNDLKWCGQIGYARTIRPGDSEQIDALALDDHHQTHVYLHSASDIQQSGIVEQEVANHR